MVKPVAGEIVAIPFPRNDPAAENSAPLWSLPIFQARI